VLDQQFTVLLGGRVATFKQLSRLIAEWRHRGVEVRQGQFDLIHVQLQAMVSRRPDPCDRRSRRVVATEAGRDLWRDRRSALVQAEADILSVLGSEKSAFKGLLQRVAVSAGGLDSSESACQVMEGLCEEEARRDGALRQASNRG
jgi:hypothetical protein